MEYHNPAAEVCLRRALLKGWGNSRKSVVDKAEIEGEEMMEARWMGKIGGGDGEGTGGLEVGVKEK